MFHQLVFQMFTTNMSFLFPISAYDLLPSIMWEIRAVVLENFNCVSSYFLFLKLCIVPHTFQTYHLFLMSFHNHHSFIFIPRNAVVSTFCTNTFIFVTNSILYVDSLYHLFFHKYLCKAIIESSLLRTSQSLNRT